MKDNHEILGVDVRGVNFGVRRNVLRTVAEKEEIIYFIKAHSELTKHRYQRNSWWNNINNSRPHQTSGKWQDINAKISMYENELKGYRKAWRCLWTDHCSHGLYTINRNINSWSLKKAQGKYGFSYSSIDAARGDIFLFLSRDKKGDIEMLHQKTNTIIKVPRGAGISDSFYRMEEKNESI